MSPRASGDRDAVKAHVMVCQNRRDAAKMKADGQFTAADAPVKLHTLYSTVDG